MIKTHKSIFEYDNYRTFLKDFYLASKAVDKKFSLRFFARGLGYSSPIFIKRIMDGSRNLTEDGISRFSKILKFNKEEALFFKHLVFLNQASNYEEKAHHASQLIRARSYKRLHPLREAQFRYYAYWYLVPVRELVGLPGFKENYDWIAQTLMPQITAAQAKKAVEELLQLGLLERDANGNLRQTSMDVTSPDEIISAFKADWLKDLIQMGAESIERIPRDKRDISSVTVGVSPDAWDEIKEQAQKFRREIMQIAAQHDGSGAEVYQLNIQLFPLTQARDQEKK